MLYNKLVRDKIPEIIAQQGESANIRVLSDKEYTAALEQKLDEETAEFHKEKNLEELADILEVVSRKASAMLGRPVRAFSVDMTKKAADNPRLEQLMNFGREHSDIIKIKNN